MLKAVIFDLNGIFIESPKLSDRFQKDFGIPASTVLPKLGEIMDKVRQPNAAPSWTYWKPVIDHWGINIGEEEFWKYWFQAEKPSEKLIALARELRGKGVKVFILSNNFRERVEFYDGFPWLHDAVDKVYFSWQTGFVKPDHRAWKTILDEYQLPPEECLYFDDSIQNVEAAKQLGIHAELFQNPEETRSIIEAML